MQEKNPRKMCACGNINNNHVTTHRCINLTSDDPNISYMYVPICCHLVSKLFLTVHF